MVSFSIRKKIEFEEKERKGFNGRIYKSLP